MRRSQGIQVALAILIIAVFTISSAPVSAQRTDPGPGIMPETFRQNINYDVAFLFCMETNGEESQNLVRMAYYSFDHNEQGGTAERCADALAMYVQMWGMPHETSFYEKEGKIGSAFLFFVPRRPNGARWLGDDQ